MAAVGTQLTLINAVISCPVRLTRHWDNLGQMNANLWYVFACTSDCIGCSSRFCCLILWPYAKAQDVHSQNTEKARSKPESPCTSCDSAVGITELKYRVAAKYRNADGTLVMRVSPRRRVRLDRDGVVAFACKLRNDFATESDVFVRLFDNDSAAKKYVDPSAQHKPPDWQAYAKSFKAFCSWNSKTNRNFVVWDFDPLVPSDQQKSYLHADFCLPQSAIAH